MQPLGTPNPRLALQFPSPPPHLFEDCPFTTALSTEGFRHKLCFKFNISH